MGRLRGSQWDGGFYGLQLKILLFLQQTVILFPVRLTEIFKKRVCWLRRLKINLHCFKTRLRSSGPLRDE